MAKKDERNLNITINNADEKSDDIIITFSTLFRKLKKYLLTWVIAAVVFVGAAFGYSTITTHNQKPTLKAIVNFSYDGIEKGLDPNGRKFDVASIKNPAVIENALTELNISMEELENIRNGISFQSIIPKNAYDRYTVYNNILEQGGSSSIAAGEKLLETTYYPTQYTVFFDYSETTLSADDAVEVFNTILNEYEDYFYKSYGYNESLGSAVTAISYNDYDYPEAIDVFENSLNTLKVYAKELADEDDTRFRSALTGYTFDDLYQAIRTVESIDLDKISSYITVNNVTKDKESALAYYEYRIKSLTRLRDQYEEQLQTYEGSINSYEKDQIIVFGGSEDTSTQSRLASEQYDKMFGQKNEVAAELARVKQQINDYKDRQQSLKSKSTGGQVKVDKIEADFKALDEKVTNLVNLVCDTSEEYYKNVTFKNAYNVLVPADSPSVNRRERILENAKKPLIILEGLGVAVFFGIVIIESLITDTRKRKAHLSVENINTAGDGGDGDDDSAEEKQSENKKTN